MNENVTTTSIDFPFFPRLLHSVDSIPIFGDDLARATERPVVPRDVLHVPDPVCDCDPARSPVQHANTLRRYFGLCAGADAPYLLVLEVFSECQAEENAARQESWIFGHA